MNTELNLSTMITTTTIDMNDILGDLKYQYMVALAACTAYLLIYVLFNMFVEIKPDSKYNWLPGSMTQWAVIPIIFQTVIVITYFTGYGGIKI